MSSHKQAMLSPAPDADVTQHVGSGIGPKIAQVQCSGVRCLFPKWPRLWRLVCYRVWQTCLTMPTIQWRTFWVSLQRWWPNGRLTTLAPWTTRGLCDPLWFWTHRAAWRTSVWTSRLQMMTWARVLKAYSGIQEVLALQYQGKNWWYFVYAFQSCV